MMGAGVFTIRHAKKKSKAGCVSRKFGVEHCSPSGATEWMQPFAKSQIFNPQKEDTVRRRVGPIERGRGRSCSRERNLPELLTIIGFPEVLYSKLLMATSRHVSQTWVRRLLLRRQRDRAKTGKTRKIRSKSHHSHRDCHDSICLSHHHDHPGRSESVWGWKGNYTSPVETQCVLDLRSNAMLEKKIDQQQGRWGPGGDDDRISAHAQEESIHVLVEMGKRK